MTSFEECIQKRIDITAYEPDSKEEMDEFFRILDHNHGVINQCSREAGFRIQSDPHYNGAIEAELWDSLNALRKGKHFVKLAPAVQEKLAKRSEEIVRYADHASDGEIIAKTSLASYAVGIPLGLLLINGGHVMVGLACLVGGVSPITVPLAVLYLHYRK